MGLPGAGALLPLAVLPVGMEPAWPEHRAGPGGERECFGSFVFHQREFPVDDPKKSFSQQEFQGKMDVLVSKLYVHSI